MVRLFNITSNGKEISCDYEPEQSNKIGHVSVSIDTEEVKDINFSSYEYGKKMYVSQVRSKLSELIQLKKPLPKEMTVVWY